MDVTRDLRIVLQKFDLMIAKKAFIMAFDGTLNGMFDRIDASSSDGHRRWLYLALLHKLGLDMN